MNDKTEDPRDGVELRDRTDRRVRADAQRNIEALLQAAREVFATSGVDAPVREIAEKAGVGVGTVYRHFPQRSDLIAAVFRREIDACADIGRDSLLASERDHVGGDALLVSVVDLRDAHHRRTHAARNHRDCRLLRHPGSSA